MKRMLVRQGNLATHGEVVRADILVEDGRIARIEDKISPPRDADVVEAGGMLVLPGGVDPHVHMGFRFAGVGSCDDFSSGSRAALAGGTTTYVDFALPKKGQTLWEAVNARVIEGTSVGYADFSLHCIVREINARVLGEIPALVAHGVSSFKVFTTYDEQSLRLDPADLLYLFETVATAGGMVTVHAEEPSIVNRLTQELVSRQQLVLEHHPRARPALAETAMVALVLEIAAATACPVYFHHISTARAVELIARAKAAGQAVYAETCPHYLLLEDGVYQGANAADFAVTPPLRTPADQERLWEGLRDGTIDTVGTDHCPFYRDQKRAVGSDFTKIPNGFPGVETRLVLIYSTGVVGGKLSIDRWIEACCRRPAMLFGLTPAKGDLLPGSDADLVLFDPDAEGRIEVQRQHSNCDWSPFDGMEIRGGVCATIRRGELVWRDGAFLVDSRGMFIRQRGNRECKRQHWTLTREEA